MLTVWHDGTVVAQTPANTGISQAPTPDGTFPVYERLAIQTMGRHQPRRHRTTPTLSSGSRTSTAATPSTTSPVRATAPQSLGGVENPYQTGQTIWLHLTLGSLVTVAG